MKLPPPFPAVVVRVSRTTPGFAVFHEGGMPAVAARIVKDVRLKFAAAAPRTLS